MIDVWWVVSNSLWVAGLALLLATLSWAWWAASVEGVRARAALARAGARRVWGLGLALFGAGMAATGRAWWERALWGALAVAMLIYGWGPSVPGRGDKEGRAS